MSRKVRDYDEDFFTSKTPAWYLGMLVLLIVGITLLAGALGLILGWFNEGARQVSPTNVKAQFAFAYDYDEQLKTIARQDCTARRAVTEAVDPAVKVARQSQQIAVENNYNRVQAEYDGRLRDIFRTKVIRPPDVPSLAPSLADNLTAIGCTP